MSTARKKRSSRDRELDRLHRRLNSPRPDLPVLRTAERHQSTPESQQKGLAPRSPEPPAPSAATTTANLTTSISLPLVGRAGEGGEQPTTHAPSVSPDSALDTQHSALPEWSRLLPLPSTLPATFRRWLIRHIETTFRPNINDSTEQYLAARIALAMAHQHLAAAREPDKLCTTWLRYEAMSDRQYRNALRDWTNHQKTKPKASPFCPPLPSAEGRGEAHQANPKPPATPLPNPPNPHNATFAHINNSPPSTPPQIQGQATPPPHPLGANHATQRPPTPIPA